MFFPLYSVTVLLGMNFNRLPNEIKYECKKKKYQKEIKKNLLQSIIYYCSQTKGDPLKRVSTQRKSNSTTNKKIQSSYSVKAAELCVVHSTADKSVELTFCLSNIFLSK